MADTAHLKHGPLDMAVLWMTAGSLLLFWVPILNGVVAGAMGGWRAGHVGRATLAAAISTVLSTAVLVIGYYGFQVNPNHIWSGMSLWPFVGATFGGLLVGAIPSAIARRYGGTRELLPAAAERLRAGNRVL